MKTQDTNFNPKMKMDNELAKAQQEYKGKFVEYAGGKYEVYGVTNLFGCLFVQIYDEPPSKHVDMVKLSSVKLINDNVESSSEPLEEKPLLHSAISKVRDLLMEINNLTKYKENHDDILYDFGASNKKAKQALLEVNKIFKIINTNSSLESELKEAKKSVQLLHEDMINAEKRGQEKAESEIKALREERDKFAIGFFDFLHSTWNGYLIKPYKEYMIIKPNWMLYESAVKEIDKGNTHGFYTVEFLFEQFKQSKPIP